MEDITIIRLIWAGHAWRKKCILLRVVLKNAAHGKRPLEHPRLHWEDRVKEDVKKVNPEEH